MDEWATSKALVDSASSLSNQQYVFLAMVGAFMLASLVSFGVAAYNGCCVNNPSASNVGSKVVLE